MEKKTAVIACETIRDELLKVKEEIKCGYPVLWLPSGLHNTPDKLRSTLSERMKENRETERFLFAMGYCGNSVEGLEAGNAELVIPRVDDCISLLLGSVTRRKELCRGCGTYFFTKGWLNGERNLWAEYRYTVEKYGEKRAKRVMSAMLHNYERLAVVDTGAYELEKILPETTGMAKEFGLKHEILPGSGEYLRSLLTGPWEEPRFLVVKPGGRVEAEALMKFY